MDRGDRAYRGNPNTIKIGEDPEEEGKILRLQAMALTHPDQYARLKNYSKEEILDTIGKMSDLKLGTLLGGLQNKTTGPYTSHDRHPDLQPTHSRQNTQSPNEIQYRRYTPEN